MATGLAIFGDRTSGETVREDNVTAALTVANVVKSSLGPVGLDKMLVNEVGDVTITNDGATILQQLDIKHPAGQVLVELSQLQDKEVGDGTTSVVIIASELLKKANELVKSGIHPTSVISGYMLACSEAVKYIEEHLSLSVEALGRECLLSAARTSMSSKIINVDAELFANMAVDAICKVKTEKKGKTRYPLKAISILMAQGQGLSDSELVDGFALNNTGAAQQMPKNINNAKIAILDIDLRRTKLAFGVQVLVSDSKSLEQIRDRELDMTKETIQMILKAGANVVLTTKGIDDMALKYFTDAGVIACRRCERDDLRRIAKATGGKLILSLADLEGEQSVDASLFGEASCVTQERVGDNEMLFFKGCKSTAAQTIVLRGANEFMLAEVDRSLHDSLSIVKRTLESGQVVPGGGAVESALSVYLEHLAETMSSREQLAVAEFAQALLIIPKTLAINGALDAAELSAKLRAYHNAAQTEEGKSEYRFTGLDLHGGKVRNSVKAGVLEPAMSKIKSIRFATEAAVTLLRIDDAIKMHPKAAQQDPHGH